MVPGTSQCTYIMSVFHPFFTFVGDSYQFYSSSYVATYQVNHVYICELLTSKSHSESGQQISIVSQLAANRAIGYNTTQIQPAQTKPRHSYTTELVVY